MFNIGPTIDRDFNSYYLVQKFQTLGASDSPGGLVEHIAGLTPRMYEAREFKLLSSFQMTLRGSLL